MKEIEKPFILFVEGEDDLHFFENLLSHLKLPNVQIIDCKGVDNFKNKILLYFQSDGFKNLKSIGLIRDADSNFENAFMKIKNILIDCDKIQSIPIPNKAGEINSDNHIKIGTFILPNNSNSGMLESLCLESIKEAKVYKCVEDYINCSIPNLNSEDREKFKEEKARVQTYLASQVPLVKSIGVGAQKKIWDFDHPCFKMISKFMLGLFD